ncbi:MAG: hypothetical protein ACRCV9_17510 [Burkholderiaceae bacterium]
MAQSRVTPEGLAMGKSAARLAELGRARLVEMGLDSVKGPRLRDEMCKTCACRLGTVPNGCLQTQMDFLKAAAEGKPFQCHAPLDGTLCAGWVRARAELVASPLPAPAMALIAKWDYSPPDDESPNVIYSDETRK